MRTEGKPRHHHMRKRGASSSVHCLTIEYLVSRVLYLHSLIAVALISTLVI
jgi:hypothetical protein